MHDDSCIGINYAHRFSKCFRSLHTSLGFSLCTSCRQFNLSLYQFIQFLTCARIPCRDSHCENGSFEVLPLHTCHAHNTTKHHAIQQRIASQSVVAVHTSCNLSNCVEGRNGLGIRTQHC